MIRTTAAFLLVLLLLRTCLGYNLDADLPIIKRGASGSLFGLTVAQHHTREVVNAREQVVMLIGAPTAERSGLGKVGSVFRCPVTTSEEDCQELNIDSLSENNVPTLDQWLGVTIKSEKPGGLVGVCAHRWNAYGNQTTADTTTGAYADTLYGKCFVLFSNLEPWDIYSPMTPCKEIGSTKPKIKTQQYCQAGSSLAFGKKNECAYFGMPGMYAWSGAVAIQDLSQDYWINSGFHYTNLEYLKDIGINYNSYNGMAIATGKNRAENASGFYASGAPRHNDTGAVVVFSTGEKSESMEVRAVLTGQLVASAFGYAVEACDVNGDGNDDLIVSAPQYFDRQAKRGGAVYVFVNRAGADGLHAVFDSQPDDVIYGEVDSSLGISLASCGDLDGDGLIDVAIGASGHHGNRGAVFIHRGTPEGLQVEPTQVIAPPDDGEEESVGFGYSVSGGLDMDLNGYPDVMVGSLSNRAFLYRSRPVVVVNASLTTSEKVIKFMSEDEEEMGFVVEACLVYTSYIDTPLALNYNISLDTVNRMNERRVRFARTTSAHLHDRVLLPRGGVPECRTYEVVAKREDRVVDKLSPVTVKLAYEIDLREVETTRRRKRGLDGMKELTPVLDGGKESVVDVKLNIANNCGPDDVCRSKLTCEADYVEMNEVGKWSSLPTFEQDGAVLLVGRRRKTGVRMVVSNMEGEGAHHANLTLKLPRGLNFVRATTRPTTHSTFFKDDAAENDVSVSLGNPFKRNQRVEIVVEFSTNRSLTDDKTVTSHIELETSSVQDTVRMNLSALVTLEVDLRVEGFPDVEQVRPVGDVIGESAVTRPDDVGRSVTHTYRLFNEGSTDLDRPFNFYVAWPQSLSNGKWLFYLYDVQLDEKRSGNQAVQLHCDLDALDPLGLNDEEVLRRRRDVTDVKTSEVFSSNTGRSSFNKTESIVCKGNGEEDRGCVMIFCTIDSMEAHSWLLVNLKSVVWNGTFVEELPHTVVKVGSTLQLYNDDRKSFRFTRTSVLNFTATTSVITVLPNDVVDDGASLWVIGAAVLAGVILLVLLVLVLWCCGFFRRKRDFGGYHKARHHKQASKKAERQQMLYN